MNKLIYGAAYYPEYQPVLNIEKDLAMMKQAGLNTIRIGESTWSTWEPEEGRYDFHLLTATLKEAERTGMQVIAGTPTYAVPAWLVKKDPSIMVTTKSGQALYGARQSMDIMNPTYRKACEGIIRHMLEVTSQYDCVIGYQIDNETKHYGTAGKNVQKLFVEYLKKKFGTTENMNHAFGLAYWSNSIHDWEDMPDIRGTVNGSLAGEFEAFERQLAADFLKWQREIVDEYRKDDQFVTHNFDFEWKQSTETPFGSSYGVQPGICHQAASAAVTVAGCDIYYPGEDAFSGKEIAFCGDSTRCLKDKPYIVLETQAQGFRYQTPYPGQLMQQALSHLASGACGVEYWPWQSIHNSFETYWKGILSHDMEENRIFHECQEISAAFHALEPYLQNTHKENKAAIVIDNRSLTAMQYFPAGDYPGTPGEVLTYNDVVRRVYDAFYENNIECDVIDSSCLKLKAGKYRMLVTPALYCTSDEIIEILRRFVNDGGVLISTFKSFYADENMQVRHERQPYHMTDLFGMTFQECIRPVNTCMHGSTVHTYAELLMADNAVSYEKYDHPYWGKYAGIVRNDYGRGYAVYLGGWFEPSVFRQELGNAAERAGIERGSIAFPLVQRNLLNEREERIHFIFNYSSERKTIICPYENAVDILHGDVIQKGETIRLKDWDTIILMEKTI